MTNPAVDPVWTAIKELTDIVEMQADTIVNLVASVSTLNVIVELLEKGE